MASALAQNGLGGIGGPNLPPDDGLIAESVAAAPGGPIHVLISDREAEHVPGCNMAFRKAALDGIGGFDERFRVAGDDVDVCWRLQEAGWTLGFSAGAVVMHRRRDSVRRYLKQQYGYGKAEALLERKWPSRYNRAGSSRWSGRIYDAPPGGIPGRRAMVHYGNWGSGLFQSIYQPAPGRMANLLLAPEGLLLLAVLACVSALGVLWPPLLLAALPLLIGLVALVSRAAAGGYRAHPPVPGRPLSETFRRRALTASLYLLQPAARLAGRLRNGLSPWRRRLRPGVAWPRPRMVEVWSESWREPQAFVQALQDLLATRGGYVRSGGPFDRWDLDLRAGPLGGVKIRTAVEEHGDGKQLMRARIWPRASTGSLMVVTLLAVISAYAALHGRPEFAVASGVVLLLVVGLGNRGDRNRDERRPVGAGADEPGAGGIGPGAKAATARGSGGAAENGGGRRGRRGAAARARQCGRPVAAAADFDLERDGGRCRPREASLNEPLIGRHQNEEPQARSAVARSR